MNCPKCGESDLSKFSKNKNRPNGYQGYCKVCMKDYRANWLARNPDQIKSLRLGRRAAAWRRRNINVTKEAYDKMLEEQQGLCALCGEPFDEPRAPAVDHDHTTGKTRALLHNRCNVAIGLLGDSLQKIRLALHYLESYQKP